MTEFLIKRFVKFSENIQNNKVREGYGKLSGTVGIICNFLIAAVKLIVGLLFNSISVMADAANNFSDAMSSVVTLVGFKLSGKPADKEHPYGHERIEYVSGLLVSFFVVFLGVELVRTSFGKIMSDEQTQYSVLSFGVLVSSVFLKLWLYKFNRYIGERIDSTVVRAAAQDSLNDVVATLAVIVSGVISVIFKIELDGYAGICVALYILYSGVVLVIDTVNPLLGTAPSAELTEKIKNHVMSYEGVDGIHDLIIHNYGPKRCFATVHVEVNSKQDILISHDIADNIERDAKRFFDIELVVHLDPLIKDDEVLNEARQMIDEILNKIDSNLTFHDLRMVTGATHTNLIFDVCTPVDFPVSDGELVDIIINNVHLINRSYECVITVDKNYLL